MLENAPLILLAQSDWGILALRLALGSIMVAHGWPKLKDIKATAMGFDSIGFRPGILFGTIAGIIETFGGISLVVGWFVEWTALAIALQFIVIVAWRIKMKYPFMIGKMEFDLLVLGSALALATLGGGAYHL